MPNHYHLLLKLNPSGNMGQCLRSTFTSYTQAMNRRYLLNGTLFQGQCKIKHIESDEYCKHLIRYIHRNPVEARMCANAEDWAYSDYSTWIAQTDAGHLTRDAFFQKGVLYRRFMEEYKMDDTDLLIVVLFDEE